MNDAEVAALAAEFQAETDAAAKPPEKAEPEPDVEPTEEEIAKAIEDADKPAPQRGADGKFKPADGKPKAKADAKDDDEADPPSTRPAEEPAKIEPPADRRSKQLLDLARRDQAARAAKEEAEAAKAEAAKEREAARLEREAAVAERAKGADAEKDLTEIAAAMQIADPAKKREAIGRLRKRLGVDFAPLAQAVVAYAQAEPEEAQPEDPREVEARAMRKAREDFESWTKTQQAAIAQREAEATYAAIVGEVRANLDKYESIKRVASSEMLTQRLGDPMDQVVGVMLHAFNNGAEVQIDGEVYRIKPGQRMPVDLAARVVDNGFMQLRSAFAGGDSTQPPPAAAAQAPMPASETPKPGSEPSKKPRTLPNSRASTPTSAVRETREPRSDEELFQQIADEFHGQPLWTE
jgi:hypothetical protein